MSIEMKHTHSEELLPQIDLTTIHPQPGDIIIATYDKELITQELAGHIYNILESLFPGYKVIFTPKDVELKAETKENLIQWLNE